MIMRFLIAKLLPTAAGLVLLLGVSGCRQGENDRCQIDSDCDNGLYCELAGNSRAQGGYCRLINAATPDLSTPAPTGDAAPPADMAAAADLGDLAAAVDGGG
jgi:hypothetical protein